MTSAAIGSSVAYSYLLEATGLPVTDAHQLFEERLDNAGTPTAEPAELTVDEQRELLRAQMQAAGTDATYRAFAGAPA